MSYLARQYLKPSFSWQELACYNKLPETGVIAAGTPLRIPLNWLAIKPAHAKLTATSGDVQIQDSHGTWRQAQTGEPVQTGQHIKVGINSSARLKFADDSEFVMQPQSSVAMDTLSVYVGGYMVDTQVRLSRARNPFPPNSSNPPRCPKTPFLGLSISQWPSIGWPKTTSRLGSCKSGATRRWLNWC